MGNLRSVAKGLEAAGGRVTVTSSPSEVARCDGLCLPGQGIFGRCMDALASSGLGEVVRDWIARGRPYLGICLGMQVLFESSEERGQDGKAPSGLGLLAGRVERLPRSATVPHIGWNQVGAEWFFFDHSYAVKPADTSSVAGWCEHGTKFAAWIEDGPVTAVQFHPEKSSRAGIALLRAWLTR
jgi:glutamine amidotransferase